MLDDDMTVLARSETSNVMPKRREQDDVSLRCRCNKVQGRGASCTQVEEGVCVWGVRGDDNCLCVRRLSHMHIDMCDCDTGSVHTVATNLDHSAPIVRSWLWETGQVK